MSRRSLAPRIAFPPRLPFLRPVLNLPDCLIGNRNSRCDCLKLHCFPKGKIHYSREQATSQLHYGWASCSAPVDLSRRRNIVLEDPSGNKGGNCLSHRKLGENEKIIPRRLSDLDVTSAPSGLPNIAAGQRPFGTGH